MDAILLEPLSAAHVAAVAARVGDEEVLRFTRVPTPVPPDFAQTWVRRHEEGRRDGTREAFAVVDGRCSCCRLC